MDALTLLTADHNRVRGLFKRFQAAHEAQNDFRATELSTTIVQELEVHTAIEEAVFYPAIRDLETVRELVAEAYEEHAVAKELIQEIRGLTPQDERWAAKMKVLIENVEHHADEEENEMWPKLRSACDATMLNRLAEQLEAEKRQLGAPTMADKIDLTKQELAAKAREQEIPGRSKMNHDELAATVAP